MRTPLPRLESMVRLGKLVHVPPNPPADTWGLPSEVEAWSHVPSHTSAHCSLHTAEETLSEEIGAGLEVPGQGAADLTLSLGICMHSSGPDSSLSM